jgi:hypothetical protein
LYECKHNPTVIYKYGLNKRETDGEEEDDYDDWKTMGRPDFIVETEGFKQDCA